MPSITRYVPTCRTNERWRFTITSLCNDCFGEPLAPTVVHLVVTSSAEVLGHPEVEDTHNPRVPSSVVQRTGPVEAGRGKTDERMCSVALGVFDEDACETVAAIRSWSTEVVHQTSVQECSSEGGQVQGWARWVSEGTEAEQHGCSR